ncbi:hypothetical protein [Roseivivax sp. CAU 1761]
MTEPVWAREPLSAIRWLGRDAPSVVPVPPAAPPGSATAPSRNEPPVSVTAAVPQVTEEPLGPVQAGAVGLVPPQTSGLPLTLWQDSDPQTLAQLIPAAEPTVPALQALLNTLMLAEADPPRRDAPEGIFLGLRVQRLMADGALDAAAALLERAGPDSAALFPLWFDLALLTGEVEPACSALEEDPRLSSDVAARVFCAARSGAWPRAALAFESGRALGALGGREADLLERFLAPEIAEELPSLPPPLHPTPLQATLHDAVGEPLPASGLSRRYAWRDLSGDRGWKAQLDAAERLARAGALSENRLLEIYTLRAPAASGGVWDRVAAVQRMERALAEGRPQKIASALDDLWPRMLEAGLAVPAARLFGPDVIARPPAPGGAATAFRMALLSDAYGRAAALAGPGPADAFLAGLAAGAPSGAEPSGLPLAAAVQAGFDPATGSLPLVAMAERNRLGEAILRAIALFDSGVAGNGRDLTEALATLRALGLEDIARRAALQAIVLSERESQR